MYHTICSHLTSISISIMIAFISTLLFYAGIITDPFILLIFSLVLSLLSLMLIGLLGISDNGLTRQKLCQNCLILIISIIGNILFTLLALTIPVTVRQYSISNYHRTICFLFYIQFDPFNSFAAFYCSIYLKRRLLASFLTHNNVLLIY